MSLSRRGLIATLATLTLARPALAADAPAPWTAFRARFLQPDGRIVDTGNGGVSHTEGQSYGLLLAETANDREAFDRIWRWTQAHLARTDVKLFSWRFDPAHEPNVADPNNATDGDLMIAWALMRAARRWSEPTYEQAAAEIRAAVAARLVADSPLGPVLLPGLDGFKAADGTLTFNLSYYVWPALDAFAAAEPDGPWTKLIGSGEALCAKARFGANALPADWTTLAADGTLSPAKAWPARFGYDAVRIPLYLAWSHRAALLAPFQAYWRPKLSATTPPPAWIDVVSGETANYAAPGMVAVARWVCGLSPSPEAPNADYYNSALAALAATAATEV